MKMEILVPSRGKGQSLIEIVVAVGIIVVVLVGVSDLITRSVGLSIFQSSKSVAENIAQNQLTYYRQQRDQRPTDFFINPGTTCVGTFDAKYTCGITYSVIGNGVEMKVRVGWSDGGRGINTELSQVLAKPTK